MRAINLMLGSLVLIFSWTINASVPSLSDEDREFSASAIVEGKIVYLGSSTVEFAPDVANEVFIVAVRVANVIKGYGLQVGDLLNFNYWQSAVRPDFECGDVGQNAKMVQGTQVRVFLYRDDYGMYRLMNPNGFENM